MKFINTIITGTGSIIPSEKIINREFSGNVFCEKDGQAIPAANEEIIEKFKEITGIEERRYVPSDMHASDLGAIAAERAIGDSGVDRETLDYIILAHNFGDIIDSTIQSDAVPSLASRVKHKLGIKNPNCVAYDILFGCPGWIQGVIQAHAFIKADMAKKCLVIGAETLSRVSDPHDRDSMIYADGAGAVVVEAIESEEQTGILSTAAVSHTCDENGYLYMGKSNHLGTDPKIRYIKMDGRKIYEYALNQVPLAMKVAMDKAGIAIEDLKKILIHQANEKMDEGIVVRFFKQYKLRPDISQIMPMSIHQLGNSSVATIPTLFDMILKDQLPNHKIHANDLLLFASVGAGMNINAFVYRY